jgi:hypothetical protein
VERKEFGKTQSQENQESGTKVAKAVQKVVEQNREEKVKKEWYETEKNH